MVEDSLGLRAPLASGPLLGQRPEQPVLLRGLDPGRPFSSRMAHEAGISKYALSGMVASGQLVRPFRGVYAVAGTADTMDFRVEAVRLVAPEGAVICDHTAAWLHGADLLPPAADRAVPPVQVFSKHPGNRVRLPDVDSGERRLRDSDVVEIHGLRVTSALRTTCDLGRIRDLPRALANVDGMLALRLFEHHELDAEIRRYRGMRWVTHLRTVVPMADPRAQSPAESMLRFHWVTSGLPQPVPQHPVHDIDGNEIYYLDLLDPVNGVAGEYDGVEFHGEDRRQHDAERRDWIESHYPISIEVFTRTDLFGPRADPVPKLRRAYRQRTGRWW